MSTGPDTSEFNASLPKKPKDLFNVPNVQSKKKHASTKKDPSLLSGKID